MAYGDAHSGSADPRCFADSHHLSGRYGVRVGRAAEVIARDGAQQLRPSLDLCVMAEEMRHGWQMSYLLVTHFETREKREAEKLLQRRADEHQRMLGSFNEAVENWLDFFAYTQFIDRDGIQLQMLSTSAFAPLSRSMRPC